MSGLTRDGMAERVTRAQILRRERGPYFPCSVDHQRDWQPSATCDDHTCIHTYIKLGPGKQSNGA